MTGQRRTSDESQTKMVVLGNLRPSFQRKQEELDSMFAHDEPDELDDSDLVDDEEELHFEEPVPPSAHYAERTLLDASGERSSSTRILAAPLAPFTRVKGEVFSEEGTLILAPVSVAPPDMTAPVMTAPVMGVRPIDRTMHSQPPPSSRQTMESWADRGAWTLPADDSASHPNMTARRLAATTTVTRKVPTRELVLLVASLMLAACAALTIVKINGQAQQERQMSAAVAPPEATTLVPVPAIAPVEAKPAAAPVAEPTAVTAAPVAPTAIPTINTAPATAPKSAKKAAKEKAKPEAAPAPTVKSDAEILDALREEQLRR